MYHDSVDAFRRTLVASAESWRKASDDYFRRVHAQPPGETPAEVRDAYAGTLMAYGYSYTLAAVLGVALREFGPQTARQLADIADDILENGDFEDLNADVQPGAPLPPPTPAEQAEAGQLALGQPEQVPA